MKDLNDILESDQGKFEPLIKPPVRRVVDEDSLRDPQRIRGGACSHLKKDQDRPFHSDQDAPEENRLSGRDFAITSV